MKSKRPIKTCFIAGIGIFAAYLLFSFGQVYLGGRPVSREMFAMNTLIRLTFYGKNADPALQECQKLLTGLEEHFSRHSSSSELARLNAAALHSNSTGGIAQQRVSEPLFQLLSQASAWQKKTGGAFTPLIGPLTTLWNVIGDHPHCPSDEQIQQALDLLKTSHLNLDEQQRFVTLVPRGAAVDLGGIAKGYAADRIKDLAISMDVTAGLIDLGGNVVVFGQKPDKSPWRIGVQDPRSPRGTPLKVMTIECASAQSAHQNAGFLAQFFHKADRALSPCVSLVTSGSYERFFEQDGKRYHHLLDPTTGRPADNGLLSVSVISRSSADGDALSTALFVLGLEKGLALARALPDVVIEALFVTHDGRIVSSLEGIGTHAAR